MLKTSKAPLGKPRGCCCHGESCVYGRVCTEFDTCEAGKLSRCGYPSALQMRLPIIAWHKCRICNHHRPKHPSGRKPRTPSASSGECRCLCPGQEGGWETWESRPEYRFGSLSNYVHGKSNRKQVSSSNSHVLLLEAETHSKGRAALTPQKRMCRWKSLKYIETQDFF